MNSYPQEKSSFLGVILCIARVVGSALSAAMILVGCGGGSSGPVLPPPSIVTTSLPDGTAGTLYSQMIQASGGAAPFKWAVSKGTLPHNLSLSNSALTSVTISGTPDMKQASVAFTISVTDSANRTADQSYSININLPPAPVITSTSPVSPSATIGVAYNFAFAASGAAPFTWTATPLTNGLRFNSEGTISGAPTGLPTTMGFEVTVMDAFGTPSATMPFFLMVTDASGSSNAKLNGDYAFWLQGFDGGIPGAAVAVAGRFHADGNGNLSAIQLDINRSSGVSSPTFATGTYSVNSSDNNGGMSFGGMTFRIALSNDGNGNIVEFDAPDANGTFVGGFLQHQDLSAASLSVFNGDFAFGMTGEIPRGGPFVGRIGIVGRMTSSAAGNLSNGSADITVAGASFSSALTGQLNNDFGMTTGRETATETITTPLGLLALHFANYVVNATQAFTVSTDARGATAGSFVPVASGTILKQAGGGFSTNSVAGTSILQSAGVTAGASVTTNTVLGLLIADDSGTLQPGSMMDENDSATIFTAAPIGGSFTFDSSVNGRATFTFCSGANCNPAGIKPLMAYFYGQQSAFLLEGTQADPGAEVSFGTLEPQSAPAGGFQARSFSGLYAEGSINLGANATGVGVGDFLMDGVATVSGNNVIAAPEAHPVLQSGFIPGNKFTYTASAAGRVDITFFGVPVVGYAVSPSKFYTIFTTNPTDQLPDLVVFEQ